MNMNVFGANGFDAHRHESALMGAVLAHARRVEAAPKRDSLTGHRLAQTDWTIPGLRKDAAEWFGGLAENVTVGPEKTAKRSDAAGMFFERQLEFIDPTVLREKYRPFNAMNMFAINTTVPPGARTFTTRRLKEFGRVAIYRAGQQVPQVAMAGVEERRPIHHLVCGFSYDIFDEQAADFANTSLYAEMTGLCDRLLNQRTNELMWNGDVSADIRGVLTHPYLNKKASAIPWTSATAADTIIADFTAAADFPANSTGATFMPTDVALSVRTSNFLASRPRSATTDTSILEWLQKRYAGKIAFHEAHELEDVGGTGIDGVFFWNRDPMALDFIISQTPVVLPVIVQGLDRVAVAYCSIGDARMRDSGNNLLLTVPAV